MIKHIKDTLANNNENNYGKDYKTHYLEIYKLYVERADAISSRRQSANSFFLTINTSIIAISGYMINSSDFLSFALSLAGIIICYFWYRLILSYKQLNSGKFEVIHEIESKLPLAPYDAEWVALGEGKDSSKYKPLTDTEKKVPFIFMAIHILVLISALIHIF